MQRYLLFACLFLLAPAGVFGLCSESNAEPDGVQASGAIYRIYMPEEGCWNGDLVVYAHGYVAFNEPVGIPEDHLVVDDLSIPALANALGYALAVTSYSTNGLAILEGVADVTDLVAIFNQTHPTANRVYLTGVSEGGIVTALALERHPDIFHAGLSACGPIGDFPAQINHIGNFRVVFDYLFPTVFPGKADEIPAVVIDNWDTFYVPLLGALTPASTFRIDQLLAVTKAPVDPLDPLTRTETVVDLLWYSAFATNDAAAKLGGNPFTNRGRWYSGSANDLRLNVLADRFDADPAALQSMQAYQTTGGLQKPLVTLHTTGDPVIPYWHQQIYSLKTLAAGTAGMRVNLPVERYGHCAFQAQEVLGAFVVMVLKGGGLAPSGAEDLLSDAAAKAAYRGILRSGSAAQTGAAAGSAPK